MHHGKSNSKNIARRAIDQFPFLSIINIQDNIHGQKALQIAKLILLLCCQGQKQLEITKLEI